jgi:signal recognition particle receptor subunit beta
VLLDTARRELGLKLVYDGPPLSGKTTNLRALHQRLLPATRGHLMELPTSDDRTLFFDTMPILFKRNEVKVKIRIFTVPGQALHNSTRRIVLHGADAVAFVADSQPYKRHDNFQYWAILEENLRGSGLTLDKLPHVVQWNKQDLGDESTAQAVAAMRHESRRPVYESIAVSGEGVIETFLGMVGLVHETLDREQGLSARLGLPRQAFLEEVRRCFIDPPPLPAPQPPGPAPSPESRGGVPVGKLQVKSGGA